MINEFLELCRGRQSIRKFAAEPIPDEALKQILEAAQTAPSAGNLQSYEIIIQNLAPVYEINNFGPNLSHLETASI